MQCVLLFQVGSHLQLSVHFNEEMRWSVGVCTENRTHQEVLVGVAVDQ